MRFEALKRTEKITIEKCDEIYLFLYNELVSIIDRNTIGYLDFN